MTAVKEVTADVLRPSSFGISSRSVIRPPRRSSAKAGHSSFRRAFTLIELIVVISIILVLAGLVLSTAGYARSKAKRARAETEIAAISAACEGYKADNAVYPRDPIAGTATDTVDAKTNGNPATYQTASLVLYRALSGDRNCDRAVNDTDKNFGIDGLALGTPLTELPRVYLTFKPNMLLPVGGTGPVIAITDPFSNSCGYSTANQYNSSTGYNPTFDLWSTAGLTTDPGSPDTITPQWIKNW